MLARLGSILVLVAATTATSTQTAQPSGGLHVERNVAYATRGTTSVRLDAFLPRRAAPVPAVVLVHGGGFRSGNRSALDPTAEKLARLGWAAFSIDYRLAPRFPYPAGVDDVLAAIRWVRTSARRLGVDPGRIGLIGASAGGDLAAYAATAGSGRLDVGARVRAAVSWSGPMDLATFPDQTEGGVAGVLAEYLGCAAESCPARYRAASPVSHVDHTDAPLLLANSRNEMVPLAQAREMDAALARAGVAHRLIVYSGSRHATDYETEVWAPTLAFLQRFLGPLPGSSRQR